MKALGYLLAVAIGGLGIVFVVGSQGMTARIAVGAVLVAGAVALVVAMRLRPVARTVVQKIDLSGDMSLEQIECVECGAKLSKDALSVEAGALFVTCPYCNAGYQFEEAPRW